MCEGTEKEAARGGRLAKVGYDGIRISGVRYGFDGWLMHINSRVVVAGDTAMDEEGEILGVLCPL